jgi:AraC family transcriptional activator FtrA
MAHCAKIMPDIFSPSGPLVAVLVYDDLCTFEFGVAYEVFGLPRPEIGPGWYRYVTSAIEGGPLRAAGGLMVETRGGLEVLAQADLIVVPGWRGVDAVVPTDLVSHLQRAHRRGARIMSLCSGITVLAACGFLQGRQATTHWRHAEAIGARFPEIALEPDRLYVDLGDVLTAAGSAAGIDLCLHVVRKDFGPEVANAVARRLVVPPHREGGQAQFIERPMPREREAARLGPLMDWLRQNLAAPHQIATIASRSGMSTRTLQRRFEETTGLSPGEWLIVERIRLAKEQLERSRTSTLDDVALSCGFGSLETMRHHFRRRVGISPTAYRERFAAR